MLFFQFKFVTFSQEVKKKEQHVDSNYSKPTIIIDLYIFFFRDEHFQLNRRLKTHKERLSVKYRNIVRCKHVSTIIRCLSGLNMYPQYNYSYNHIVGFNIFFIYSLKSINTCKMLIMMFHCR